jgi:hypothetical protein
MWEEVVALYYCPGYVCIWHVLLIRGHRNTYLRDNSAVSSYTTHLIVVICSLRLRHVRVALYYYPSNEGMLACSTLLLSGL